MLKKYFIKLFAITIVIIYGGLCPTTANAAYPVLKLDVGESHDPTRIEPGFDVFTITDSGSTIKGITVSIAPIEPDPCIPGYPATLKARWRWAPTGIPCELIYRDFIFSGPGGIRLTLSGFWPNEPYEITIWAFDVGSTTGGNRIADWYANGQPCLITNFIGSTSPTDCSSHAWTGPANSDANGVIVLEAYPDPNTTEQSGLNNPYAFVDALMIASVNPILIATNPVPADGNTVPATKVQLSWTAGMTATSHDVYFGETFEDVNDANTSDIEYRGSTINTFFSVGSAGQPYPTGLPANKTYYWRIDETDGVSVWKGKVWRFYVPPKTAYNPSPVNGALFADPCFLDPAVILSWYQAADANSYQVYFGVNFNDVNNGTGGTYKGTVTVTNYDPAAMLQFDTPYYWRVDANDGTTTSKGAVWSFKTSPSILGRITLDIWENITGGYTLDLLTGDPRYPDNPTRSTELTSFDTGEGIGTNYGGRIHGWLYVPLTGDYTFYFNSAAQGQLWLSTDEDPNNLMPEPLAMEYVWGSYNTFTHLSDPIPLIGGNKYYIMAIWKDVDWQDFCQAAWIGAGIRDLQIIRGCYLSPILHSTSYNQYPQYEAIDVESNPILSWMPGIYALKHDVYFGTDFNDVNNASRTNPLGVLVRANLPRTSYDITDDVNVGLLKFNTTYYWRIDDVNDPNIWKGIVWSFTTDNCLAVDNFESYNPNLADVWKPGGNATVGLSTGIAHEGGTQAMAIDYSNTPSPYYSDAYANTTGPNGLEINDVNWLKEGIKALSLWFRGEPNLKGSVIWTQSNPPLGPYSATITADGNDIWDNADQFHYAHRKLSDVGSITARVDYVENTNAWAKAGLMFRNTLDPGSINAGVVVTPGNGIYLQYRAEPNGTYQRTNITGVTAPHWVKLTRGYEGGDVYYIKAEHANDVGGSCANDWTQIGDNVDTTLDPDGWGYELYIGLCLTSHNYGVMCDANFSNVMFGDLDPQYSVLTPNWESNDIGIAYNYPEPIYVTLQDNDSNATLYYPRTYNPNYADANATQIGTWTEWNIDLNDFKDKGVTLTEVNKIYIGVGDKAPGSGSGTVYVDDIRLYRPRFVAGKLPKIPADLVYDGVINYGDLGVIADNWLLTPTDPNINLYSGSAIIDFRDFAEMGKYWYQQQVWPTW